MPQRSRPAALVTGGTRGIGWGIAQQLAGSGFDLILNGRRPAAEVSAQLHVLEELGAEALYVPADVSDRQQRQALVATARQEFGQLDALINNAGVAPETRSDVLEATEESFDRLIGINLKGPYFLTQLVAQWMIEQRRVRGDGFRGVIVNVSSISAVLASVNRGEYCISKAGVAMATQLWALRLAEFGIAVYEIRPGIIRTDMTAPVAAKYDELIENGLTLEGRWGTPADVGRAVAMLARGEITYATGNVISIDGGLTLPRL